MGTLRRIEFIGTGYLLLVTHFYMKQLLQHVRSGDAEVAEVPVPTCGKGQVLVKVAASLVSAGTERMVVDFAEKSLLNKARSRPDLVKQTIDKARREGILTTFDAVQNRLAKPMALGYSCAGTVVEVGANITDLSVGDKVACAGANYAVHAEYITVPRNLTVKLDPDANVEAAAFTTLGAIALQGIRLADVKLGEVIGVIGLGLLGQLTVQMLKAAGCTVIGMDIAADRAELALQSGADQICTDSATFIDLCRQASSGHGADSVLITADTKSDEPQETAGEAARKKGTVVAVGAIGMNLTRKPYYDKEVSFLISSSYGPGRYDAEYEEGGRDYPYGYVRWTENRNMQAFANLVSQNQVTVEHLLTHRFPIEAGAEAYALITGKTADPYLGVVLTYPQETEIVRKVALHPETSKQVGAVQLGVIGAGLFANAVLLPAIKEVDNIQRVGIVSGGGVSSRAAGDRFGFSYCATDANELLQDSNVNTVAILTRHHLHAAQVQAALEADKHVFVEKPLCLTLAELNTLRAVKATKPQQQVFVGYNRRFAPYIAELREHLKQLTEPTLLTYRVNGGFIPADHWTQDPNQGGGRLRGEGCHFIDLLLDLAGSPVSAVSTLALPDSGKYAQDNYTVTLQFANGSVGTLVYASNGDKSAGKEWLEVHGGGLSAQMNDYRTLSIRKGNLNVQRTARLRQDKGHKAEWRAFATALETGKPAISFADFAHSTAVTLAAFESLQTGQPVSLAEFDPTANAA